MRRHSRGGELPICVPCDEGAPAFSTVHRLPAAQPPRNKPKTPVEIDIGPPGELPAVRAGERLVLVSTLIDLSEEADPRRDREEDHRTNDAPRRAFSHAATLVAHKNAASARLHRWDAGE